MTSPYFPMTDLDAMIANGYGDVDRNKIPANWRDNPRAERLDLTKKLQTAGRKRGRKKGALVHGQSGYRRGCRCDVCREGERERARARFA